MATKPKRKLSAYDVRKEKGIKSLQIRVDGEVVDTINRLAAAECRSTNNYLSVLLTKHAEKAMK